MKDRSTDIDWNDVLSGARTACERAGRPLTLQRQAVLRALWKSYDHPTADNVHERVAKFAPGLSRATVFRSLETLVEVGLARRVGHYGVGVRYDARLDPHHHFICQDCGAISDFEDPELNEVSPKTPRGFTLDGVAITCVGFCPKCS